MKFYDFCFGKTMFLTAYLQINYIAWYSKRYEYNETIDMGNGFTFSSNVFDCDIFPKWKWLFLA